MTKKILVVDDEELLTKTLTMLLERSGYDVFVAKNAQDAIDMAEELQFDLLITDVRMPGMDGVSMLRQIRQIPGKQMPEIVITGYASEEKELEAKNLKVKAFIYKPFDANEVLRIIKENIS